VIRGHALTENSHNCDVLLSYSTTKPHLALTKALKMKINQNHI